MRKLLFPFLAAILIAPSLASAGSPSIRGRSCTERVTFEQPLCDLGTANVVAAPFDLYAKARDIEIDPVAGASLPAAFTAYVYDFGADVNSGWLAPPVFHIPRPYQHVPASLGTMRFTLHNVLPDALDNTIMINQAIPAGPQPVNIHTHGLVLVPHAADANGAYGDYVGVLACPQSTAASCPHEPKDLQMTQVCGVAKSAQSGHACPGMGHAGHLGPAPAAGVQHVHGHDVLLGSVNYSIDIPGIHPASFAWFHPHAHEISSAQVGAGLSGVLTIGTLCSDPSLDTASRNTFCRDVNGEPVLKPNARERVMMLKDLQVYDERQGTAPVTSGGNPTQPAKHPSAEGYRIVPTCNTPGLVAQAFCHFDADPDGAATTIAGNWLFTVNGQLKPTIAMTVGTPELWRVANISANATYRLSLRNDSPAPDNDDPALATCSSYKGFQIVSLDGGTKITDPALKAETEILLPPGARADIWIVPQVGDHFWLVQKGFKKPDLYPPAILATVTAPNPPTSAEAGGALSLGFVSAPVNAQVMSASATQPAFEKPDDCEHRPETAGVNDWLSLDGTNETVSLFFGKISGDLPEILTLGIVRGDVQTSSDPQIKAQIEDCLAGGDPDRLSCRYLKGGPFRMEDRSLCLKHGARITFRIFNLTGETHNFHIHQQKFAVSSQGTMSSTEASTAAVGGSLNQRQLASSRVAAPSTSTPQTDNTFIVDSVPVPSVWSTDAQGNLQPPAIETVTMKFDKPQQVGDFVFHCHILEHEDKGMMKRITVWTKDAH